MTHDESISWPSPVPRAATYFPRPHPSAEWVVVIGAAALLLGPLAGIPCILLAELVLREIRAASGRYTGKDTAKLGRAIGWLGTLGVSFFLLYFAAASSLRIGLTLVGLAVFSAAVAAIGEITGGAPRPFKLAASLARRAPFGVGATLAVFLTSGFAGVITKRGEDERARYQAAAQCANETRAGETALQAADFTSARRRLSRAQEACVGAELSHATSLLEGIDARQREHELRLAAERVQAEAAAVAERESQARARFPTVKETVGRSLQSAATVAGRCEAADQELTKVDAALNAFVGTQVASSPEWLELAARLQNERTRIEPCLAKARSLREARERQLAAIEAAKERQRIAREEALERQRGAAAEASRRAEEAAEREASRGLVCRDGTLSPGCRCNGPRKGCCSHHGGVLGCE